MQQAKKPKNSQRIQSKQQTTKQSFRKSMFGNKLSKQASKRKAKQRRFNRLIRDRLPAARPSPTFRGGYPEVFQKAGHPRLAVPAKQGIDWYTK